MNQIRAQNQGHPDDGVTSKSGKHGDDWER